MSFALTEDQQMVREMVRKFAADEVREHATGWDEVAALPADVFHQLHDLGLMGATMPAADGGSELDGVSFSLVLEELARQDASLAVVLASHDVALNGSPRRAQMFANGEIASVVAGNIVTSHQRLDCVLADGEVVAAPEVEPLDTLGLRAAGLGTVDVHASPPGVFKVWLAAVAVGVARAALEEAREYAQEREQFGRSISKFQAIQFKLADMATRVDAARLLVLAAARDETEPKTALRFAAQTALFVTDEAVQIHGGYGYVKEYPVERYYRDARWFSHWIDA